jgi:sucrose-phosphate synthase
MTSLDATLLVSDVDDTLLGDDRAVSEFVESYEKAQGWLLLACASGRFAPSIVSSILETDLPEPHAIIGGVGTEIVRYQDATRLDDWPERLASGWSDDRVVATLEGVSRLRLQPAPAQSQFKVSYLIEDARPGELKALEGPGVYVARSEYARGVLEGLRHWTEHPHERTEG